MLGRGSPVPPPSPSLSILKPLQYELCRPGSLIGRAGIGKGGSPPPPPPPCEQDLKTYFGATFLAEKAKEKFGIINPWRGNGMHKRCTFFLLPFLLGMGLSTSAGGGGGGGGGDILVCINPCYGALYERWKNITMFGREGEKSVSAQKETV